MALGRYMVIKVSGNAMYVLGESGDFKKVRAPRPLPKPGQVIELKAERRPAGIGVRWLAAAAAVALVAGAGLVRGAMVPPPVAVVAVDINPSVELLVGAAGTVLEAVPLNPEARALLKGGGLKGISVPQAIRLLLDRAQQAGFLRGDGEDAVLASVVLLKEERAPPLGLGELRQAVVEALEEKGIPAAVAVNLLPRGERLKAKKEGLSVNKYVALERARAKGVKLDTSALRKGSIVKTLKKSGLVPEEVLPVQKVIIPPRKKPWMDNGSRRPFEEDERSGPPERGGDGVRREPLRDEPGADDEKDHGEDRPSEERERKDHFHRPSRVDEVPRRQVPQEDQMEDSGAGSGPEDDDKHEKKRAQMDSHKEFDEDQVEETGARPGPEEDEQGEPEEIMPPNVTGTMTRQ